MTAEEHFVTDAVRALIGHETDWGPYSEPLSPSEIRRFTQAIMDNDPIYWDEEYAKTTRYGGLVTPPLFPGVAFRREAGTPDPLDYLWENPNDDGTGRAIGGARRRRGGLPPLILPLVRALNAGVEAEFFRLARPGDRVRAKERYVDIHQRQGSTGPMVIVVTETEYEDQDGNRLAIVRNTSVRR